MKFLRFYVNFLVAATALKFTMLLSFIWGSKEIIFLKLTRKIKIQDTNVWL
jgi:hypothetical protein